MQTAIKCVFAKKNTLWSYFCNANYFSFISDESDDIQWPYCANKIFSCGNDKIRNRVTFSWYSKLSTTLLGISFYFLLNSEIQGCYGSRGVCLRKNEIFSTFSFTWSVDHQLRSGFEYFRINCSSSNDSINGAPNVSGNNKDKTAAINVVTPKIIKENSWNVINGR